jgi:putative PIN family toxin of toxin-antitoxin system
MRVVVDTNGLVSALISGTGASREVIRLCLRRQCQPILGHKLFLEMEEALGRETLFKKCPLPKTEREELFAAFASVCEWTKIYYLWRPNLRDEGDNHVLELAVAGGAESIVTHNVRDFAGSELRFPDLRIWRPADFLRTMR